MDKFTTFSEEENDRMKTSVSIRKNDGTKTFSWSKKCSVKTFSWRKKWQGKDFFLNQKDSFSWKKDDRVGMEGEHPILDNSRLVCADRTWVSENKIEKKNWKNPLLFFSGALTILLQCSSTLLLHCSPALLLHCFPALLLRCSSALLLKCSPTRLLQCSLALLLHCSSAFLLHCFSALLLKCSPTLLLNYVISFLKNLNSEI